MNKLPVAVQVYSVREDAERDFAGTMKKIKEIGYDGVELAGLYGLSPAEIKAAIEDAGLEAVSAHVPSISAFSSWKGTWADTASRPASLLAAFISAGDRPYMPASSTPS